MELQYSTDERAFQAEVRSFVRDHLPEDVAEMVRRGHRVDRVDFQRWFAALYERGWSVPGWPKEYGGPGWGPTKRHIFEQTLFEFDIPTAIPFGATMVGPVIYTFGSAAQKERFLPGIRNGEAWWCQGYSEPNSGSDLASLATRAVPDGDDYVVNGSKIWTSAAQFSDWIFCLVRTDSDCKPQEGISFLLIDMTTPGIEVQPIISIDGVHHLNMVHFTEVRVPMENRVGEENAGWTYAKFLLGNERTSIAEVGESARRLRYVKNIAQAEQDGGQSLAENESFARKLAEAELDLKALEITKLRYLSEEEAGQDIGPKASLLKIKGAEIRQRITELAAEAVGYYGFVHDPGGYDPMRNEPPIGPDYLGLAMPDFLFSRAATIYGGSNEVQRNIMAKMVLGL